MYTTFVVLTQQYRIFPVNTHVGLFSVLFSMLTFCFHLVVRVGVGGFIAIGLSGYYIMDEPAQPSQRLEYCSEEAAVRHEWGAGDGVTGAPRVDQPVNMEFLLELRVSQVNGRVIVRIARVYGRHPVHR